MGEPLPAADEIRALDGPALTFLAYQLGLAPERSMVGEPLSGGLCVVMFERATVTRWEPHADIDQASAVLRQLRAHGWNTANEYWPSDARGVVNVWRDEEERELCEYYAATDAAEPLAILRACVLARAHQQRTERSA